MLMCPPLHFFEKHFQDNLKILIYLLRVFTEPLPFITWPFLPNLVIFLTFPLFMSEPILISFENPGPHLVPFPATISFPVLILRVSLVGMIPFENPHPDPDV